MLDPAFAARWQLAKAQGVARNEMLLIDCVPNTLDPETSEGADDLPRPSIAEAIRIVRMTQVAAGGRNVAEPEAPERNLEEMLDQQGADRGDRAGREPGEDRGRLDPGRSGELDPAGLGAAGLRPAAARLGRARRGGPAPVGVRCLGRRRH
jgi:hypothetical protein